MALATAVGASQCTTTITIHASLSPPDHSSCCLRAHSFSSIFSTKVSSLKHANKLRQRRCRVSSPVIVARAGFADHEAAQFRMGLFQMLETKDEFGERKEEIVDTCTKVFHEFAMNYNGELPSEPFVQMRIACQEKGFPLDKIKIATRGAIGWCRYNLYHDWKKWSVLN